MIVETYQPETEEAARFSTGMDSRLMRPDPEQIFLRCQLGRNEIDRNGEAVFALKAFGSSWSSAWSMWNEMERIREIAVLS